MAATELGSQEGKSNLSDLEISGLQKVEADSTNHPDKVCRKKSYLQRKDDFCFMFEEKDTCGKNKKMRQWN